MSGYLSEQDDTEQKDEDILAASVQHPSLFALLVRKYEEAFLRKARGIVRDEAAAEDIVQEAFVKIYLNAKKFQKVEGASFSSWAYRIVINTALTQYMKQKREQGRTAQLDEEIWALLPDKDPAPAREARVHRRGRLGPFTHAGGVCPGAHELFPRGPLAGGDGAQRGRFGGRDKDPRAPRQEGI